MESELWISNLTGRFAEKLQLATGVRIPVTDVRIEQMLDSLNIYIWGHHFNTVALNGTLEDADVQDIAMRAIFPARDARKRLLNCQFRRTEQYLGEWAADIKASLKQQQVAADFVDRLVFKVVDYVPAYKPAQNQMEQPRGLAVEVSHKDNFYASFPVKATDAVEPLDIEDFKTDLFVSILESRLANGTGPDAIN